MNVFAINGTFLSEKRTGIFRFAEEIIKALDEDAGNESFRLVIPRGTKIPFDLKNIKVIEFGFGKGILWEQFFFAMYLWLHRIVALNLCNVTPLLAPRGYTVIHDVSYKVNPHYFKHWYGRLSRRWHCLNYWYVCRFARFIFSVSEFSKREIISNYGVPEKKVSVVPNAWQHMMRIRPAEESVFSKYGLKQKKYFLSLSTIAPNKNLKWVLNVAKENPDKTFAIAGSLNPIRFGMDLNIDDLKNVKFLGYISDGEFVTLAKNSEAFVFPSFYEGFGLPPLEALSVGAPIIVSDIDVFKEIFGDSVHYVDPCSTKIDLAEFLKKNVASPEKVLKKYSWLESSRKMKKCFRT